MINLLNLNLHLSTVPLHIIIFIGYQTKDDIALAGHQLGLYCKLTDPMPQENTQNMSQLLTVKERLTISE